MCSFLLLIRFLPHLLPKNHQLRQRLFPIGTTFLSNCSGPFDNPLKIVSNLLLFNVHKSWKTFFLILHKFLLHKLSIIFASFLFSCRPDQSSNILIEFIEQIYIGNEIPIHSVAYDCSNQQTNVGNQVSYIPVYDFVN